MDGLEGGAAAVSARENIGGCAGDGAPSFLRRRDRETSSERHPPGGNFFHRGPWAGEKGLSRLGTPLISIPNLKGGSQEAGQRKQGEVERIEAVHEPLKPFSGVSLFPGAGQSAQHPQIVARYIQKAVSDGTCGEIRQHPLNQTPAGEDHRREEPQRPLPAGKISRQIIGEDQQNVAFAALHGEKPGQDSGGGAYRHPGEGMDPLRQMPVYRQGSKA